ncbi:MULTISPECIES: cytochrome P450 [unclassified Streptomyces]|uniref:cytochrome P450 n=1 Tax=unclassified Streptomyces TaxID=2593676 RepID=UPI00344EC2FC
MPGIATSTVSSDLDLFADDVLADPFPAYATLRALGPAVHLTRHGVWAITRHADVKAVLADAETFTSHGGLALNETAQRTFLSEAVLAADGARHARLRRVLSAQLAPRAIARLQNSVEERADRLAQEVVAHGAFDAVNDLAMVLVSDVVLELMGLSAESHPYLHTWSDATLTSFGPDNDRTRAGLPLTRAMRDHLSASVTRDNVAPNSWMAAIFTAVDRGEVSEAEGVALMIAYTVAGMDTTVHSIATTLHQLAAHPDQWQAMRAAPDRLAPAAHAEALRYAAPVRSFGRRVTRDTRVGGTPIPAGAQIWVVYASAGRDSAQWGPDADSYNLHRPGVTEHLSLGHGVHRCAGNHLATLEATALLRALARHTPTLQRDPKATPRRALNNILYGWATMPLTTSLVTM